MKLTNSYTLEWFIKIYVFALISKCTGIFNKQIYCIDESTCDIVWTRTNALRRRGVTRWDGIRGEKQVWRPYVRTWDLSEPNALYWRKYLWHSWDFSGAPTITRRPPQWFSAPIAIRSPGNCAPLPPIVTPLLRRESQLSRNDTNFLKLMLLGGPRNVLHRRNMFSKYIANISEVYSDNEKWRKR